MYELHLHVLTLQRCCMSLPRAALLEADRRNGRLELGSFGG